MITQKGAEPGEVVPAGQMILKLAQQSGRDAVFNIPAQAIRDGLSLGQEVEVWLADNPDIKAAGKLREISPQADPVTRNYQVKVELADPPSGMFLGATVVGRLKLKAESLIEVPSSALTMIEDKPAVWVVDAKDQCVHRRRDRHCALCAGLGHRDGRAEIRRKGCNSRGAGLHEGQTVKLLGGTIMKDFNLTEWAIRHKSLVIYFMLVSVVAGVSAYLHLGRNEDPEFTVKTMVVQTLWPGATQEETMQQVTDRIEKKLQDTPNLYYLKSYTIAGQSTIFVYLLESTPKKSVSDLWYQVRKKVGDIRQTLPQGVVGPFFNDEFGDTYGIIYGFTADGFSHRELRDYAEEARSRLLRVKDVSKAEFLGTQDERIYVEFSTHRLAELGMDRMELVRTLVTQNAVVPSGVIQTKNDSVLMDVTGRFESEKDLRQVNFIVRRQDDAPERHRNDHARLCRSAAADLSRQRQGRHRVGALNAHRRRHSRFGKESRSGDG